MNVFRAGAAGIAVALLGVSAWSQAPDLERLDLVLRSVPDGPVAKVNGVNIGKAEYVAAYQAELTGLMLRLKTREIPDRLRVETGVRCVALLVQRELLHQEALRRKLSVSDEEVEDHWNKEVERIRKAAAKAGEEAVSEEALLRMTGATRAGAKAELRKALLIEKARQQLGKEQGIGVTESEIKGFYDEHKDMFHRPEALHLKQIFLNAPKSGETENSSQRTEARERIADALMRIQAGETFEAVARDVSQAPDRERGGDMGTIPAEALPPFFVGPAGSMKPGDLSDVIESDLGFHVFMLVESVSGGAVPLDKAKAGIRKILGAKKLDEAVAKFCEPHMKEPGRIEVYLDLERTLATHPGFEDFRSKKARGEEG